MKKYTQKTINYYDAIADAYTKSTAAVVLRDQIGRFAELLPGRKVLDIACGPGHDTNYLNEKGYNCVGIDLSRKMIEIARNKFKGRFEVMDFFDLKFENNSFDGLWCSSIFVHIHKNDIRGLLNKAKRVLKRNGIIGIITARKQKRVKDKSDTRTYRMFDEKELENYLQKAGFKIILGEIFTYGGKERIFMIFKRISREN
ncbi:hypothetical protein A3F62_05090 [Candidatus Woesebacteria bacterium RIFCSPHIGHO2_12_FULL_44_11]|nr:MAG: hypothetical protein A3F62_05090 [Candidatus Woesebacteria bacterium RIFCSPHIGHO2_12_FULL_44_11]